jgi:hypothetical protein
MIIDLYAAMAITTININKEGKKNTVGDYSS